MSNSKAKLTLVWVSKWDDEENSVPSGGHAVLYGEVPIKEVGIRIVQIAKAAGRKYGRGLVLALNSEGVPVGNRYRTADTRVKSTDTRKRRKATLIEAA